MPRYYFHIRRRTLALDTEGVVLADDAEAWKQATTACGEMMRDLDGALKRGPEWRMEVVDDTDRHLFTVHFGGEVTHEDRNRRGEPAAASSVVLSGDGMELKAMRDDRNDIRRPVGSDPYLQKRPRMSDRANRGWGIPVGITALLLLAGFLFYNSGGHGPDRPAPDKMPAVIQTNPSGPERPAPTQTPAR